MLRSTVLDKTRFVEAAQLLGVKGLGDARELYPWRHFSVGPDFDAEVNIVGVEVDAGGERRDTTQVNLEDTVGNSDTLGFGPQNGTTTSSWPWTRNRVDAEDHRVAAIGHVGAIAEIDYFTLEIDLVVDASGGVSSVRAREAKQTKTTG